VLRKLLSLLPALPVASVTRFAKEFLPVGLRNPASRFAARSDLTRSFPLHGVDYVTRNCANRNRYRRYPLVSWFDDLPFASRQKKSLNTPLYI
jgi:hypothetical protein